MLRQVTFAIFVAAATRRYKEALAKLGGHISPVLRPKPPHTGTASGTNPGASSKQPHTRLVERPPRIQLIGVQTNRSENGQPAAPCCGGRARRLAGFGPCFRVSDAGQRVGWMVWTIGAAPAHRLQPVTLRDTDRAVPGTHSGGSSVEPLQGPARLFPHGRK